MRKTLLLLAFAAPLPALAHHGEPHPPMLAQAAPRPDASAIQEMQRERANPGAPAGVQAQRRAAEEADTAELGNALAQLRAARQAVAQRRYGPANELVERAEARLLTRSTLAAAADQPLQRGPVGHLAAARAALQRQDQAAALRELDAVIAMAERGRTPR